MIDVKSLRVGNLVQDGVGEKERVTARLIGQIERGLIIYPIPLTPEILEKCGAEKADKSQFGGYLIRLNDDEQIRIVHDDINGWHWPLFGYTVAKVGYVHQLQNLIYDLSGEELDIEL